MAKLPSIEDLEQISSDMKAMINELLELFNFNLQIIDYKFFKNKPQNIAMLSDDMFNLFDRFYTAERYRPLSEIEYRALAKLKEKKAKIAEISKTIGLAYNNLIIFFENVIDKLEEMQGIELKEKSGSKKKEKKQDVIVEETPDSDQGDNPEESS